MIKNENKNKLIPTEKFLSTVQFEKTPIYFHLLHFYVLHIWDMRAKVK